MNKPLRKRKESTSLRQYCMKKLWKQLQAYVPVHGMAQILVVWVKVVKVAGHKAKLTVKIAPKIKTQNTMNLVTK